MSEEEVGVEFLGDSLVLGKFPAVVRRQRMNAGRKGRQQANHHAVVHQHLRAFKPVHDSRQLPGVVEDFSGGNQMFAHGVVPQREQTRHVFRGRAAAGQVHGRCVGAR